MDKKDKSTLPKEVIKHLKDIDYDILIDPDKIFLIGNSDSNKTLDDKIKELRIKHVKNKCKIL